MVRVNSTGKARMLTIPMPPIFTNILVLETPEMNDVIRSLIASRFTICKIALKNMRVLAGT